MANKKKSIKGTQTERNLQIQYQAESRPYKNYIYKDPQSDTDTN